MAYAITLFGNRMGATVNKDYIVAETTSYKQARSIIKLNSGWGNIVEHATLKAARLSNQEYVKEVMAQCLSIKHVNLKA